MQTGSIYTGRRIVKLVLIHEYVNTAVIHTIGYLKRQVKKKGKKKKKKKKTKNRRTDQRIF